MGLNELSPKTRVKRGEKIEDEICECLNEHYGFGLEKASFVENTRKKIDRFIQGKTGRIPVQVKGRFSGDDILYDLYEPYCGIGDPRTKPGRDHKGEFKVYICLSKDRRIIRVVNVESMRAIIGEIENEWSASGHKLPFFSEKHPGCELRWHEDQWSGTPKVLCFLNTDVFKPNKDIKFYEMKTKETSNG